MIPARRTLKRTVSVVVALVVVASVLSIVPTGVGAQEQPAQDPEPNDAPVGGTPVLSEELRGTLNPFGDDTDWYVVTADAGETIEATATFEIGDQYATVRMRILAPNGTELVDTEKTGEQIGTAVVAPTSGLYYIGVQSDTIRRNISSSSIPYTLTVSPTMNTTPPRYTNTPNLSGQPQSESEPNNARVGGTTIQGGLVNGTLDTPSDEDWFTIRAEAGDRIEAFAQSNNIGDEGIRMEIIAPNESMISYTTKHGSSRVEVATIAPQTGTYYIHLSSTDASGSIPYSLTVFAAGTPVPSTNQRSTSDTPVGNASTTNASASYPPGYTASGITNPKRAINQWSSVLATYDSYTLRVNNTAVQQSSSDTIQSNQFIIRINSKEKRARANETIRNRSGQYHTARYLRNSTQYVLREVPAAPSPQYSASRVAFNETAGAEGVSSFQQFLANANYGNSEFIKRNGTTLIRYTATNLTNPSGFFEGSTVNLNVMEFNATLLVTPEGSIHRFSYVAMYEVPGRQVRQVVDTRLFAINTTTAEKPNWLDAAKANTSLQSATATTEQPGPTASATGSATTTSGNASNGARSGDNTSTETSSSGPGFGPVVAAIALLAVALLAARRRPE